ncbi:tRNA lysidine(34) synthetase TilS [uncultured Paraglaciecola sp.]|uniref:tRNA lysidine(34) synthetase TilS n=1 Tax=uncultured Paraglaciecola sp. TaxID=1765024 RepID=UPI0025F19A40|nr:tRNA lysidine(34) synthetase TilS [uncultured Paraglaciecola sp.]
MSILNTLKEQLSCEPLSSATHLVVAYSGGVDSHVLLHALHSVLQEAQFSFELSAIHIHHGLSQHADQWQTHCQQVCADLHIDFQTANVSVEVVSRQSLEAQAREARYNKLVALAPANSQVLLGQHQDDQLETFLLQLKRGAGPKGLSSMNRTWNVQCPLQSDKKVGFYRPLLDSSQQVIWDYALQHKLQWCEDESNQNTDFERNFLRHDVLPVLQGRWPEISRSVARSATLCAEQQSLLDETCAEKLKQIRASVYSLHLPALKQLSQSWLHQIVRYWLSELGMQNPSLAVLSRLTPDLLEAAEDSTPILQWNTWQFRRFDQQLFVINVPVKHNAYSKEWLGEEKIQLPDGLGGLLFSKSVKTPVDGKSQITIDPALGAVVIRLGGYGAKFKPAGADHSKPVKQWFKQWKIAPWLRESVVFILQNEKVLALIIEERLHPGQSAQCQNENDFLVSLRLENTL